MEYSKFLFLCILFTLSSGTFAQIPSFPGAEGFGAGSSGGRGGRVIYVTNLNADGPGSLQDALNQTGRRYILFKVSGVIPATAEVLPGHGDFTLAGQTSPNGVIVRGFQSYAENAPSSGNFIIRHIRSRVGDLNAYPSAHWIGADGITLGGVHQAIIDHCSFAHAFDEAVDISRSSSLTIQNCLLAETLGGHSNLGGILINYSDAGNRLDSLSIHHNTWHRIGGRMPEISCETAWCGGKTINIELSNNLFWDPQIELWYEGVTGHGSNFYLHMNAVNNLSYARPTYGNGMFHIDMLYPQNNQLFFEGNWLFLYPNYHDYDLFYCCNDFNQNNPNHNTGAAQILNERLPFPSIEYTATEELLDYAANNAGAFPRDVMDLRLIGNITDDKIDPSSINVDHYHDAFSLSGNNVLPTDSDDDGMPDYWETRKGLNPAVQDHNGNQLSNSLTGFNGYTNLECYLNCLSDYLVNGFNTGSCDIGIATGIGELSVESINIYPNPGYDQITLELPEMSEQTTIRITDAMGKIIMQKQVDTTKQVLDVSRLNPGLYEISITNKKQSWNRGWFRSY